MAWALWIPPAPSYALSAFLDFLVIHTATLCPFLFVSLQPATQLPLKHGPKLTRFLDLMKPGRVITCLRHGVPGGTVRERLRRTPLAIPGRGRENCAVFGSSVPADAGK